MPLKGSTETKMDCQERRGGRIDRTWTIVEVGGSSRIFSSRILGKRIKLVLANSLIYYLPSTL
ncbi:hypothetical protein HN873_040868 [Arachis hypogaea]